MVNFEIPPYEAMPIDSRSRNPLKKQAEELRMREGLSSAMCNRLPDRRTAPLHSTHEASRRKGLCHLLTACRKTGWDGLFSRTRTREIILSLQIMRVLYSLLLIQLARYLHGQTEPQSLVNSRRNGVQSARQYARACPQSPSSWNRTVPPFGGTDQILH
jgi:hypothetical protein